VALVDGKICIVTGGVGSIGFATVEALLSEGARVMLVDLDGDKLQRVTSGLNTDKAALVAADVARTEDVRRDVDETVQRGGKINVLFSNAGNDGPLFDEQIPLGRHAAPAEIAQAICFLASNRSSFISDAPLMVDGAFCASREDFEACSTAHS
jgi:NAD(P)-dependent dehydrogenase (short-subunit alcohol dehydrogenase family)